MYKGILDLIMFLGLGGWITVIGIFFGLYVGGYEGAVLFAIPGVAIGAIDQLIKWQKKRTNNPY